MRTLALFLLLATALPIAALAQSNPATGRSSGVVHGQPPDMRQDLHGSPGGPPLSRNEQVRQRAAQAQQSLTPEQRAARRAEQQAQRRARQQQRAQRQQQQRDARQQRQAAQGHQQRAERTAGGTPGGRVPDSVAAQEARLTEARRRQAEAERRAAEAQDGVRFGPGPLGATR